MPVHKIVWKCKLGTHLFFLELQYSFIIFNLLNLSVTFRSVWAFLKSLIRTLISTNVTEVSWAVQYPSLYPVNFFYLWWTRRREKEATHTFTQGKFPVSCSELSGTTENLNQMAGTGLKSFVPFPAFFLCFCSVCLFVCFWHVNISHTKYMNQVYELIPTYTVPCHFHLLPQQPIYVRSVLKYSS